MPPFGLVEVLGIVCEVFLRVFYPLIFSLFCYTILIVTTGCNYRSIFIL